MNFVREMFGSFNVGSAIRDAQHEIMYLVQSSVHKATRYILRSLLTILLILLAIVFISGAGFFFLVDYTLLGRAASALIVGIVILLIALLIKVIK